MAGARAEAELHDLHARQIVCFPKRDDGFRDEPQVLRQDRQLAERAEQRIEQRPPGPLHPSALLRRGRIGCHLVVRLETTEVIEPHEIDDFEGGANAFNPPGVAALLMEFPAIDRIAPQLAGRREVIGRDSGNHRRMPALVELEQVAVGPNIGAVVGHEDRDVADNLDAALVRVGAHRRPLMEEQELAELLCLHRVAQPPAGIRECAGFAPRQRRRPRRPRPALVFGLERHEQGVVIEPMGVCLAELLELTRQLRAAALEARPRGLQHRELRVDDGAKIDNALGELWHPFEIR